MAAHNMFPQGMPDGLAATHPCVFVSHRRADKPIARQVTEYFESIGLHYWFDEQDLMIQQELAKGHSQDRALVESIDMGVKHCSHLLGIVSSNTMGSWWVPYEIGCARTADLETAFIVVHDVPDLPEYVRIARLLSSRGDLGSWSIPLAAKPFQHKLAADLRERAQDPYEAETFGGGWGEEYDELVTRKYGELADLGRKSLARIGAWNE